MYQITTKSQTAPLETMPTGDLRKSLFLSAKVLDLQRALATYEVGERIDGWMERKGEWMCVCVALWLTHVLNGHPHTAHPK